MNNYLFKQKCQFFKETDTSGYIVVRWSISIGVSLHLHTAGNKSLSHLCRRFYKYINRPVNILLTTKYLQTPVISVRRFKIDFVPYVTNL